MIRTSPVTGRNVWPDRTLTHAVDIPHFFFRHAPVRYYALVVVGIPLNLSYGIPLWLYFRYNVAVCTGTITYIQVCMYSSM
jgi:hypothetical protein